MKKILALVALFSLLLWAEGDHDLQSKIARMQQLPKSERYQLMNEIKRELAKLNARQRSIALGKLRASMHGGGAQRGEGMQHEKRMQKTMQRMQQQKLQMPHMEMPRPEKTQPLPLPKRIPGMPHGK